MAYTADCVPPSEKKTSLYFRPGWFAMLIDNICERSLSVSPKRFCMLSNLLRYFLWSNRILQSELLMILSFTIGEEIISSISCVTTIASPKYFRTVL